MVKLKKTKYVYGLHRIKQQLLNHDETILYKVNNTSLYSIVSLNGN